ncbi:MAG: PQQ-dependent sugar dehydrogenase [Dehalococcoidia bacterium]
MAFPGLPALPRPIQMVELPGQAWMLVALQEGRIVAFPKHGPYANPVTVYDRRTTTSTSGNEMGLLSIALDPAFDANGYLYVYYSPTGPARTTRLSRFATAGTGADFRVDESSELPLLVIPQPFPNHNGGTIAFGPDGLLYLGLGDGGSGGDPRGYAQDRSILLGSIIRIDVRDATEPDPYAIPPDNPFVGSADARPEIWAYGLRNPWRMSFDPETGLLWAGDVGQNRIEEVDIIRRGGNYGWNIMEGSDCFQPRTGCDTTGLELPVAEYGIASAAECAVTGGFVYRGTAVPALRGWYVYGDYCTGRTWALDAAAAARGEPVEPVLLWESGPTISSFATDSAGELYFLSFDGQIYRVTAAE